MKITLSLSICLLKLCNINEWKIVIQFNYIESKFRPNIFFFEFTSEIAPSFAAERQSWPCRYVDTEKQNQKCKAMYPFKCVTVFNHLTHCCINIFLKNIG